MINRRSFLKYGSIAATTSLTTGWGHWLAAVPSVNGQSKRLIVVILRGAADGLNIVVPYQEAAYYKARPKIAIPKPGEGGGVLDLDGRFGLHPALADLMPLWKSKQLGFIHASGSPDPTRSHFEAQDYLENGTPGVNKTTDGWLNRVLANLTGTINATRAISIGPTTPYILTGRKPSSNLAPGGRTSVLDRPRFRTAFDQMYQGNDALSQAYREGKQSRSLFKTDLEQEMVAASKGAPTPDYLAREAKRLAQLMAGKSGTQLAVISLGGWDTHVNQGNQQGQLANRLKPLGQGLLTLSQSLGNLWDDTVVVVVSEFGRTVKENGNQGTDHGHGNVMWVMGGGLKGGKVHGQWPGLNPSQLYEGRDLAITTDFRDAIAPLLTTHMGLSPSVIGKVFPNHAAKNTISLL
jgi:uncharacterized protein (DUF1501 family)